MNQKIKNASPTSLDGIDFKSDLERSTYKLFKECGFDPKYEIVTFTLFNGFKPWLLFFSRNREKHLSVEKKTVLPITYTPDFTMVYKDLYIVIEVKGFANDVFPYKFKMFRKTLETIARHDNRYKYILVEIFTQTQLKEFISVLKAYDPMECKISEEDLNYCLNDDYGRLIAKALLDSKNYQDLETLIRKEQRRRAKEVKAQGGNAWKDDRYVKMFSLINTLAVYNVTVGIEDACLDALETSSEL